MASNKKKLGVSEPIDMNFLLKEFDTLEERLEYIFSDVDFDKMKRYFPERPRRGNNYDQEIMEQLTKFLESKK